MLFKIAEKNKQVSDYEIGERLSEMAAADNIPENTLPKAMQDYILSYKGYAKNASESKTNIRNDREQNQGAISQDTTAAVNPDNLTDEQWLALQNEQQTSEQIDNFLDGLQQDETDTH